MTDNGNNENATTSIEVPDVPDVNVPRKDLPVGPGLMLDPVTRQLAIVDETVNELRVALMRAQTDFIRAQEGYIHDRDLTAFLASQQLFINAMGAYLHQVGDQVLADVQEQFIGVQITALTRIGVL